MGDPGVMEAADADLVLLDTNVMLTGAMSPLSHAGELNQLDRCRYVTTGAIRDQVSKKISGSDRDPLVGRAAEMFVDAYLALLRCDTFDVEVEVTAHDEEVWGAAAVLGADWICTYNLGHMLGSVPARTPRGLARHYDPYGQILEDPDLGCSGTLLVVGRRYGGRGVPLRASNGTVVGIDLTGQAVLRTPEGEMTVSKGHLPERVVYTLSIRYDSEGRYEIANWVNEGEAGSPLTSRILLAGRASFWPPIKTMPSIGQGEIWVFTGLDQWVSGPSLRLAAVDQTLDLRRSESVGDLLDRIEIESARNGTGTEWLMAGINAPERRSVLPMKFRRTD